MTKEKLNEILTEAYELGVRFPDLPNIDVIEFIEYVAQVKIRLGTVIERAIYFAYDGEIEAARRFAA